MNEKIDFVKPFDEKVVNKYVKKYTNTYTIKMKLLQALFLPCLLVTKLNSNRLMKHKKSFYVVKKTNLTSLKSFFQVNPVELLKFFSKLITLLKLERTMFLEVV